MTQDEINKELDEALEEAVFNCDITEESSMEELKAAIWARVQFTEEQWRGYTHYCLQMWMEGLMRAPVTERVQ